MSYHLVGNADPTSVELMPFSALEDDQELQAEDYAYRQHNSSDPSLWNYSFGLPSNHGNYFATSERWQDFRDSATRRWHLLSKPRQRRLQFLLVLSGVLLIVLTLETMVKTIYHNHVKPTAPMMDDWDTAMDDDFFFNENNAQEQDNMQDTMTIQDCDISVNRVLCEQLINPLFQILDDSLDHYCFQRNKMLCNGELVYEKDGSFYTADWSGSELLPDDFAVKDNCEPKGPDIWSPLAPFHPSYDQVCQDVSTNQNTTTNRFCKPDDTVDWIKVQQLLPHCLMASNPHDCNDLNWNTFQQVMGGHLNCWEFEIAFRYMDIQKHPGLDSTKSRNHGDQICKRTKNNNR